MAQPGTTILASSSSDRRVVFPDWPNWALAMLSVGAGGAVLGNDPSNIYYIWSIHLPDTPENREALSKAPGGYTAAGEYVENNHYYETPIIWSRVQAGAPWRDWAPALGGFAPENPALKLRDALAPDLEFKIPSPNDLLPDAAFLKASSAFTNLVPGVLMDAQEDEGVSHQARVMTQRAQFPNLFASFQEVYNG